MGFFDFLKGDSASHKKSPVFYPSQLKSAINSAKYLKTDLIEFTTASPYCEECAKYVNRIYSISGRDRRFPALKRVLDADSGHNFACLSFYPYTYGVSEPSFKCRNIVKHSNRPFVDERTPSEIKRYNDWKSMIAADAAKKARAEQCRSEYSWLQKYLPNQCPKSLSGYVRMKNSESENYRKLVSAAAKLGKTLL